MSLHSYRQSLKLMRDDPSFYAYIMAAMRKADTDNLAKLRLVFPETWDELSARYNAPGGCVTDGELAMLHALIAAEQADVERVSCDAEAGEHI